MVLALRKPATLLVTNIKRDYHEGIRANFNDHRYCISNIFTIFMDVTVDVGDGTRVNNIGLMAQQQNFL